MQDWLHDALTLSAHGALYIMVMLALATLISEDIACVAAGLLVAEGSLSFGAAVAACFVGIIVGDLMLVMVGRTLGRRAVTVIPLRWVIAPESLARAERWFSQRGLGIMMASRFMPGTRLPTYLAAGVLRAPLLPFICWFLVAGAIWTPLLVGAAVILGEGASRLFAQWAGAVPGLIAAGVLVYLLSRLVIALSTHRGRRLLRGRVRRLTHWQFWPRWLIYSPVVFYLLWLGVRYRSLSLPLVVNPGSGDGGRLEVRSKSGMLHGLGGAEGRVAQWTLIPDAERDALAEVRDFMARERIAFPLVLKPDVGARGKSVMIVRDDAALEAAVAMLRPPYIAQEYVPGVEYGVFYFRRPSAARGEVLAITDKRLPYVRGDGRRTLEELILSDERAVCLGQFFLRMHVDRLEEVPPAGEQVRLSEIASHGQGALFMDTTAQLTPDLDAAIERVSRTFPGFSFGHYDVRADSEAAFQRGEFKIIELNGVTSKLTSIYDPRHSLWFAWRILCRKWRLAFEIANEHRSRGVPAPTWREAWRMMSATNRPTTPRGAP